MRLKLRHIARKSNEELQEGFNPINLDYIFDEHDPLAPWIEEQEAPVLDGDNIDWLNDDECDEAGVIDHTNPELGVSPPFRYSVDGAETSLGGRNAKCHERGNRVGDIAANDDVDGGGSVGGGREGVNADHEARDDSEDSDDDDDDGSHDGGDEDGTEDDDDDGDGHGGDVCGGDVAGGFTLARRDKYSGHASPRHRGKNSPIATENQRLSTYSEPTYSPSPGFAGRQRTLLNYGSGAGCGSSGGEHSVSSAFGYVNFGCDESISSQQQYGSYSFGQSFNDPSYNEPSSSNSWGQNVYEQTHYNWGTYDSIRSQASSESSSLFGIFPYTIDQGQERNEADQQHDPPRHSFWW